MGPVVIIDTPGLDVVGELGEQRVARAKQVLQQTDVAILVVDSQKGLSDIDRELIALFQEKKLPHIIAFNKADLLTSVPNAAENEIYVSAQENFNIYELKEKIAAMAKEADSDKKILADLVELNDTVVLVIPIDSSAPKG